MSRSRFLVEVIVKDIVVLLPLVKLFAPWTWNALGELPKAEQGSVLSMMGFLMTAAIVGAFEVNYSRTNLSSVAERVMAHLTKALLFLAIGMLIMIALGAMGITPGFFNSPIAVAALFVFIALLLHDLGDALTAHRGVSHAPTI
jgi:sterol desaturase/sphingolipid hydroxylase (fatty acid hydroxylase superfamily)